VPAAAPAASSADEEAFQAGEAAFRAGDTRAAEGHYRRAVELNPTHVEALLQLARVVSWHERLEESISIYERALEVDPGNLRGRLGLAVVESWTADFRRATEIYEGILSEHPGHREATLGLARTRAWAGDTSTAAGLYQDLLRADPRDIEARNGLAQALSWQGRLDQALALYDESLAQEPDNAEALAGRARILLWQGRSPQAWEAAGEAAKIHSEHREVIKVQEAIEERFASEVNASAGVMHDSDKNAIDTQNVVFSLTPAPPVSLAFSYTRFDASQPCGGMLYASSPCDRVFNDPVTGPEQAFPDKRLASRLETIRGLGSLRVGPDLSLSASAGLERIDRERGDISLQGTASAGADYRLNDDWSFSGSLSRETFAATALTLDRSVGIAAATASASWTPLGVLGTRLTMQRADFNDGNDRNLLAGYARWTLPPRRPHVALTWNGRYLTYGDPEAGRDNGYFAPDTFEAFIGGVEVGDRIGNKIGWSATGTLGLQWVRPDADSGRNKDTVRGYYLTASYDIGSRVTLEAWLGRTNLALQGPTGFTSMESGVRLKWKTGWLAPGLRTTSPSSPPSGVDGGGGPK